MHDRLIVIASYPTTVDADIARMRLVEAGITARLSDETIVANLAILSNAVMGVKILVVDTDADRARAILDDADTQDRAMQADHAATWMCPDCGTTIEGGFAVCWSCGTSHSGERDPTFTADDDDAPAPDDEQEGQFQALEQASRTIRDDSNPYRAPFVQSAPAKPLTRSDVEDHPADADAIVMRAWRASVFGLVMCPPLLNVYSAFLLLSIAVQSSELSRRGNRRYFWAWVVNVLSVIWAAYFLRLYVLW